MHNGIKVFLGVIVASVVFAAAANAGEIRLTTHDGSLTLSGTFAGFNQDAYVIVHQGRELNVPAHVVVCQGEDCLQFDGDVVITALAFGN